MPPKRLGKTKKQRRLRKRRSTRRRQKGGSEEISTIFDLEEATENEQGSVIEALRTALEQRKANGFQNWLVFFAKFGNPGEQARFASTNWVFSDTDSMSHVQNDSDRLLIKLNFDHKDRVRQVLETCSGLFDYITFDGAISGNNIQSETVDSFVQALTNDGILACSYSKSEIKEDGETYRAGIFNLPTGEVPMGSGTNPPPPTLYKLRGLLWLMIKAKRMGVTFPESIQEIATAVELDTFPPNCTARLVNFYANMYRTPVDKECKKHNEKIIEVASRLTDIVERKEELLETMRNAWSLPVFDTKMMIAESAVDDYEKEDLVVLIQKKSV